MDVNKCDVVIYMRYCIIIPFLCILLIPRNKSEPTNNNHVVIVAAAKFRSAKKQQMKAHVGNQRPCNRDEQNSNKGGDQLIGQQLN